MKNIIYDTDNREVTTLYQWDINQTIYITGDYDSEVNDISCYISNDGNIAYLVTGLLDNDRVKIDIPNVLLQQDNTLYIRIVKEIKPDYYIRLPIKKKPKPTGYEWMNEIQAHLKSRMVQATISETEEYIKANSTIIGA